MEIIRGPMPEIILQREGPFVNFVFIRKCPTCGNDFEDDFYGMDQSEFETLFPELRGIPLDPDTYTGPEFDVRYEADSFVARWPQLQDVVDWIAR